MYGITIHYTLSLGELIDILLIILKAVPEYNFRQIRALFSFLKKIDLICLKIFRGKTLYNFVHTKYLSSNISL